MLVLVETSWPAPQPLLAFFLLVPLKNHNQICSYYFPAVCSTPPNTEEELICEEESVITEPMSDGGPTEQAPNGR